MKDLRNIKKLFEITKPCKKGDKLLILATAPDVKVYFENENVRKQFEGYDVAALNRMCLLSEDEMHKYRPRYIMFMDDIFYRDDFYGPGTVNTRKKDCEAMFERIDWECEVVTPFLASFDVQNPLVKYIKLGIFTARYSSFTRWLYKHNLFSPGYNTVVMGAIYYGITFGYKEIALLGFSYSPGKIYMDEDGLHEIEYMHYYDTEKHEEFVPYDEIYEGGEPFLLRRSKRAIESAKILWDLAKYANDMGVEVVNYTPENMVDVFRTKRLSL